MNPNLLDPGKYAFLTSAQKAKLNADAQAGMVQGATQPKTIRDLGYASPDALEEEGFRSEFGIASSSKGADIVNQAKTAEAKMTVQPPTEKTTKKEDKAVVDTSITFVNPQTGQTAIIADPAINRQTIQNLISSGYSVQEAKGGVPTWLQQKPDGTASVTPQSSEEQDFQNIKTQADNDLLKLRNFESELSNDPVLANILSNVSQQWESRIRGAEQSVASRNAAMQTAGFRLGARYGGGSAGPTAGIISAEERAGMEKISDLLAQKNSALAEARSAYETKKWDRYVKLVEISEKKLADSKEAIAALNKVTAEENKKIRDREIQATRDGAIAGLLNQGITDPKEMIDLLNYDEDGNQIGDFTSEELKKTLENFDKQIGGEGSVEKLSEDFRDFYYLQKNQPEALPQGVTDPVSWRRYTLALKEQAKKTPTVFTGDGGTTNRGTPNEGGISSLADIDKLPVSQLTKAVMAGFIKSKDLTPTDKAAVASELYAVNFNPNTYILNKLNGLIALYANVPSNYKGVIQGFVQPYASNRSQEVATFESARSVLTREIARLNDVGVLSDQDVATYEKAMPSRMDDSLAIGIGKIAGLSQTISGKSVNENVGKTGTLKDGREFIVSFDGETLLDPTTGKPLE